MHNFVKTAAVLLMSACVLASCARGVRVESVDKSYSTDTIFVDAKIPRISGLSSASLQESVNDEYERVLTDMLDDFSEAAKSTGDSSVFTVTTTEQYNKNGFLSVVTQADARAGGAHQSSRRITKNIDTRLSCELKLSDLFEGDGYIDMINARLADEVEKNAEKYAGLWEKPKLSQNQSFYVNETSLVLYYPPYELSYYERGFVEIPLSLADMSGYLKPAYRDLAAKPTPRRL